MDDAQGGARKVVITRCKDGTAAEEADFVAVEEPLEIRLDGHPVAVVMRTPGHDRELAMGFLVTEGIVPGTEAVRKIACDGNRILAFLHEGVEVDLGKLTRNMYTGSSCGICGKATLEAIFAGFPRLTESRVPADAALLAAPEKLRAAQGNFSSTGGLHAAGLFGADGEALVVREDIGRHNAVDKVMGRALMDGIDPSETWLLVSGRVSFEIMQKALAGRIPCVAGISAPSSLAVDFARESGQTLFGFLRPPGFNRYF